MGAGKQAPALIGPEPAVDRKALHCGEAAAPMAAVPGF